MLDNSGNSVQTCFVPDLGGKYTSAFHSVSTGLSVEVCAFYHIKEVPIDSYFIEFLKSEMCVDLVTSPLAYPETLPENQNV